MPTSSLFFLFIDFGFDEVLLGVIRGENLQVWVRLLTFRKFELFNLVILCIGGCQSEKSPFSARYEDGKLYYEGEWYVVLWLTYICYFATAVHTWQWLLRLNYIPWVVFVDNGAKVPIIIISSLHSFFKVPQRWSCTDREQKWYTFQVCLQLIFLMLHVIVNLLSNLFFL